LEPFVGGEPVASCTATLASGCAAWTGDEVATPTDTLSAPAGPEVEMVVAAREPARPALTEAPADTPARFAPRLVEALTPVVEPPTWVEAVAFTDGALVPADAFAFTPVLFAPTCTEVLTEGWATLGTHAAPLTWTPAVVARAATGAPADGAALPA
jgi:hypothetical protein